MTSAASGAAGGGIRATFAAGGQVGQDLLAVDWAATPLGPPETWPQSLQTVVRIVLSSRFSMWMAWGPELTFFCNDAYRRDTLGRKYPWALGRPTAQVWAEIWPDIWPRIEAVLSTGVSTWDEGLLLLLERSGYLEETYHTFSYSPLTDDGGRIVGMLCVVSEDTDRVISQRHLTTLRDLATDPPSARTEDAAVALAQRHLAADPLSLPFTALYLYDEVGTDRPATLRLAATSGLPPGSPAAPALLVPGDGPWPVPGRAVDAVVDDLEGRFPALPTGAWDRPPSRALVTPLPEQGQPRPYGFLVVGLNPYRPLDEGYLGFLHLLAGQLAAGVGSARAYEAERRRAEALAELDRAKTAFFTNVSHEFRTPLTLMLGPAEDALTDTSHPLHPAQLHRVEVMHRNAQRLLKLVNTLLDFSRLESGRVSAHYEPVDLARYTTELVSMFEGALERAGLTLRLDAPALPEPVYVDTEMWAKIVLNLLSNALKFTFAGGIDVRLAMTAGADGAVELSVADTGIGIEPAEQGRLFERFHRVSDARSRTHEGSGIGLALVAELAALHGGTVGVTSTPGEGSAFHVRLPLGAAHLPADRILDGGQEAAAEATGGLRQAGGFVAEALRWLAPAAPDEDVDEPPAAAGQPRVLVVDDNADMRDYIASLLADRYRVETAPDGAVGLAQALAAPPDLVLTDVMMPNLDGFGLLAALHAEPATAHVPVIMLSARAGEEVTVEGLEAGADDYLVKPFAARELLARVRSNIELDRARRAQTELERRQALLDQAQRLARVGSWEIDLATGGIVASEELARQLCVSPEELRTEGLEAAFTRRIHPDDIGRVRAALDAGTRGERLDYEVRIATPEGELRTYRTLGEAALDEQGRVVRLRGSNQDITDQRQVEQALAAAAAAQEAAAREHGIADALQRSLLPPRTFDPQGLEVATYYRAGVEGTQVGGDWYDVIELDRGRTALVLGDVMGRGVRAATVMGQLRAAARAYARLDLSPAQVLQFLDQAVRDLGEDQIVTCAYAAFDPANRTLTLANAGHLPPLLTRPGQPTRALTGAGGPPLGTGPLVLEEEQATLPEGALLALYTDGLVERRDRDLDSGIALLAELLTDTVRPLEKVPDDLIEAMLPDGPDDDVAVLLARVEVLPE